MKHSSTSPSSQSQNSNENGARNKRIPAGSIIVLDGHVACMIMTDVDLLLGENVDVTLGVPLDMTNSYTICELPHNTQDVRIASHTECAAFHSALAQLHLEEAERCAEA